MYSEYGIPGAMPVPMAMPPFKQEYDYSFSPQNSQQQQTAGVTLNDSSPSYTLDGDNQKRKMSQSETASDGAEDESPGDDADGYNKKPRKPGRKPETTIPASKRKAQNRAAQRAFRERKEKHLRDLETKISQLEGETALKNSENEFLRFQVQRLQNELKMYRDKGVSATVPVSTGLTNFQPTPIPEMSAKAFTFEFPTYNVPKITDAEREAREQLQREQIRGYLQRKPSSVTSDSTSSPASQTSCNQSPATDPSSYTSPQGGNPQQYSNIKPVEQATSHSTRAGKRDPYAIDFCAELSKACVNKAEVLSKVNSPVATMTTPGAAGSSPAVMPQKPASVSAPASAQAPAPIQQTMAPGVTTGSNVPGSDFLFDIPFDMDFLSYRDPISETAPMDDFFLPELTTETSMFDPLEPSVNGDLNTGNLPPDDVKKEDEEDLLTFSKPKTLMNCTAVWDRITSHPKFGDIDIEGLCSELRNKAKCSESGVVLTELDVDGVLSTFQ